MDTIFTRDSTLSPSETLQRASSVLSSIQHPVSFLPSDHFYAGWYHYIYGLFTI